MDDPRLTREQIAASRVIARGYRIRDIERLTLQYGGQPRSWRKLSTRPFPDAPGRFIELHWYEHHGLGRFEIKEVPVTI